MSNDEDNINNALSVISWKENITDSLVGNSLPGRILNRIPGGQIARARLEETEERIFKQLKKRLDAADSSDIWGANEHQALSHPRDILRQHLERSLATITPLQAEEMYFARILNDLLPDEVRILAALSDGETVYPILNVRTGSKLGITMEDEISCVSNIGKNAGVYNSDLTPYYIQHLLHWKLVEVLSEKINDNTIYQVLESEKSIRTAMELAKSQGRRASLQRQSLVISPLGKRLWEVCQ